jgi:ABC-type transport system substrate-binding protein
MERRNISLLKIFFVLFLSLTIVDCDKKEDQTTSESQEVDSESQDTTTEAQETTTEPQSGKSLLAKSRYSDSNEYFNIVPPAGWQTQKYPEDPRGKVAFFGPDDVELRVLAKGLDHSSFEDMTKELKAMEGKLGINTNIEKTTFSDQTAIKRTFSFRGTRILFIDFMIGNTTHNLMYTGSPANFDKYLSLAWESMNTYDPTLRGISEEDVKKHRIARSLRLSTIFFENENYHLALQFIEEGLEVEPSNVELLELKKKITTR